MRLGFTWFTCYFGGSFLASMPTAYIAFGPWDLVWLRYTVGVMGFLGLILILAAFCLNALVAGMIKDAGWVVKTVKEGRSGHYLYTRGETTLKAKSPYSALEWIMAPEDHKPCLFV